MTSNAPLQTGNWRRRIALPAMALLVAALVADAVLAAAQPEPTAADIVWVVQGEFCEPETVLPLPDNTLLVSNVCDFRTRGDGFLSLLDGRGEVLDWRIVDDLDAPLGMALSEDRLYVVDTNRILVFGWPGYRLLDTYTLDTAVANDVAVATDGTVYVTDTGRGQVVRRTPDGTRSILMGETEFNGANGIALAGDRLFVGGARLWCINLRDESIETIGPDWLVDIDGIELEADGTLQLTPVGGPLIRYRHDDDIEVHAGDGVSSANHGYAPALGLALIPTGFDNTVIAIGVSGK